MSDKAATGVSYTASAATLVLGALSLNDWVMLGGLATGLAGLLYNIWFKERVIKVIRERGVNIMEETQ